MVVVNCTKSLSRALIRVASNADASQKRTSNARRSDLPRSTPSAACRLLWLLFDFDDARLGGFCLGQGHREHAVEVAGLRLAAVDARGEDEGTVEQSIAALGAQIVLTLFLLLLLTLGLDGQGVAFQLHLDVLRAVARQIDLYLDGVFGLHDVRGRILRNELRKAAVRQVAKQIVKLCGQRERRAERDQPRRRTMKRVPTGNHLLSPMFCASMARFCSNHFEQFQQNHSRRSVKAPETRNLSRICCYVRQASQAGLRLRECRRNGMERRMPATNPPAWAHQATPLAMPARVLSSRLPLRS